MNQFEAARYRTAEMEVIEEASRVLGRNVVGEQPINTLTGLLNVIVSKDALLEKRNETIADLKSQLDKFNKAPEELEQSSVPNTFDFDKIHTALKIVELGKAVGADLFEAAQTQLLNFLSESKTDK